MTHTLRLSAAFGCLLGAMACTSIVNGKLEGSDVDCTGSADGTACGEGRICLSEVCLNTRCGDGFVDTEAGEDCEDANEIAGDGCEPSSCVFSCRSADECADEDPCNGIELCGETSHSCEPGPLPTEETGCELEGGMAGVCSGGLCATPGCGDGFEDEGEECDDGNLVMGDGCEPNCTFTCAEDIDCFNGDACDGEETCDPAEHTCRAGTALVCDDGDSCTADACDPEDGCTFTLIDNDGDGYATPDECTTPELQGGDCSDMNDGVYPGAPELCDTVDNDCDDTTDEDIVEVQCFADRDNDGYGDTAFSMSACICPMDTVPPRPDGNVDCDDRDSNVHEGQISFFSTPHCTSCGSALPYDYNCDGEETKRYTTLASTCAGITRCTGSGWVGRFAPACGTSADYQTCSGFGGRTCTGTTRRTAQSCR